MSQLQFEPIVLAVRAQGINGNDIAECWDGEDFTDQFPLSLKAQDVCACFEAMMHYFATNFFSGKQRVSMIAIVSLPTLAGVHLPLFTVAYSDSTYCI